MMAHTGALISHIVEAGGSEVAIVSEAPLEGGGYEIVVPECFRGA